MIDPLSILNLSRSDGSAFVITARDSYTPRALLGRAATLAVDLRALEAGGGRVIVSLDSGPDFVSALAGCLLAGATPVLLDPLVRRELLGAIAETDAKAVICSTRGNESLPDGVSVLVPSGAETEPWDAPPWADEDPILYLFTSGSTGRPVLVPKTFRQLDVEIRFLNRLFGEPRRVGTLVPWCHIFGLLTSLLVPARLGGVCDLTSGISPKRVLLRAREGLLDLVVAVPAVYQVMIRYLAQGGISPMPDSCRFTSSGAPLNPALRARFAELTGRPIIDLYGSTEAGGVAYREDDGPWIVEPHVETRVAEEGFLEVRSDSVSISGEDGFYRIGDLVRFEGRGFTLLGREDDVVKIGGRRTALGEVAEAVEACPGVAHAAVIAKRIRGTVRLVAYVEPVDPGLKSQAVKGFVRGLLADHKVPRVVEIVQRLPRTPAGKIDRKLLDLPQEEG